MEYSVRVRVAGGVVAVAAVVGLSILTSTYVATRAYERRAKQAAAQSAQISVRGSARQRITSDLAVWVIGVRAEAPELAAAFEAMDAATRRVSDFLAGQKFAEGEIELSAIDTRLFRKSDEKGKETREVAGVGMERQFTVSSKDVAKVAGASAAVTELLRDGVQVVSYRPSFYYTKLPDLRITIAGEAARDAKARADEIASKSGARVTDVRSLYMAPIQVTQPNSTDVSGSGSYDTATIDKDEFVSVTATYGIGS
jgi:hypothetical protein